MKRIRSFRRIITCLLSVVFGSYTLYSQTVDRATLDRLTDKYVKDSFDMLHAFLSIPNDAHFPDHVEQNIKWIQQAFGKRGFETTVLPTEGIPLLLAKRPAAHADKTVLIYLQIDGQPVDSSKWDQESPYMPVLKKYDGAQWTAIPWDNLKGRIDPDWRIFARSASDAKGPVIMFLTALGIFDSENFKQNYNIKVIMDFEEELGSPSLPAGVEKHKDVLQSDMLIIFDGPRHISNKPSLTFGARGIATITLTVFGPRVPQHSGHYGNYAPNPAFRLSKLLASMKDEYGRVTIPGFYKGIKLDSKTLKILAQVPDDEDEIMEKIGIAETDRVGRTYQEAIQYPSINIRGLSSGWVGSEVRTIVPSTATAEIDVRLTPETDPERLIQLIKTHIEDQEYHLIEGRPTDEDRLKYGRIVSFEYDISYEAFRTPFDSEVGLWLYDAMVRAFNEEPIRKRMSGGSIPIAPFIHTLNIPAVTVPTVNSDNNQHSPNENLRVGNYIEGVKTFLSILTQPFNE